MLLSRIKSDAPHEENVGKVIGFSKSDLTRPSSGTNPEKRIPNLKSRARIEMIHNRCVGQGRGEREEVEERRKRWASKTGLIN